MRTAIILPLLAIAGCAGVSTAMQYDQTVHLFVMPDDTYRIFEHPKGDRIMTTPSMGKAIGQGLAQGATLGIVKMGTPEERQEAAARKYLDETGRAHCVITRGLLVLEPQYEFFFECKAA